MEEVLARRKPDRIRLTIADRHVVMWQPRIANDSVVGTVARPNARRGDEREIALGLRDVERIETRGFNSGRTVLLSLASLAVATGVALFVALGAAISGSD